MNTEQILKERINEAIEFAKDAMCTSGDHHKTWYIDQIVKVLAGEDYNKVTADLKEETDMDWDTGMEP
jgi:hypothetical protein